MLRCSPQAASSNHIAALVMSSHDPFWFLLVRKSKLSFPILPEPSISTTGTILSLIWKRSLHPRVYQALIFVASHLRRTPPSREALRHSGGDRRRCTSPTVTLYLELELSSERRPGTEQKTSAGLDRADRPRPSFPTLRAERDEPFSLDGMGTAEEAEEAL